MAATSFQPDSDGFAFSNHWTFDETEKKTIRDICLRAASYWNLLLGSPALLLNVIGLKDRLFNWIDKMLIEPYGLCGGMAFAALDYYLSNDHTLPRGTKKKKPTRKTDEGKRLRSYLWKRLLDSLSLNIHTFLLWMFMLHHVPERRLFGGGPRWLARQTYRHWGRLKKHIDSGHPWPIGLVGTTTDPTTNHQVLAVGYEDPGDGTGVVVVYDMNCPGPGREIRFKLTSEQFKVTHEDCPSEARGPLQGFFCEVYRQDPSPPAIDWP